MNTDLESTILYKKALGCLLGGLIGDAMGTPTEGKDYRDIEQQFGWVDDFDCSGTDDTVMKHLLSEALIRSEGYATLDDWAQVWLDRWEAIFGPKVGKFFISVLHTAHKLRLHAVPRMAALGNMPSSSSAMCIAPVGIVNACNPRQAAMQAYNLASLIHIHDVGFCQDGAAAIAAAVAAAFIPGATVDTVLETATSAILKLSGKDMLARIEQLLALAREAADYRAFRAATYAGAERYFCRITCDSRETIPLALAFFYLAEGDVEKSVCYAANFGRDADTTGAMCGAMTGALHGVGGIKDEWVHKVARYTSLSQETLAADLVKVTIDKSETERAAWGALDSISS